MNEVTTVDERSLAAPRSVAAVLEQQPGRSALFVRRLLGTPTTLAAFIMLAGMILLAVLASLIAPYEPLEIHAADRLLGPSTKYLMGTDELGRDMLSILLYSARISLLVAMGAEAIAVLIGTTLGLVAGLRGGRVDDLIMRVLDGLLAFPSLLTGITIVGLFGANVPNLLAAIGIMNMPYLARIVRAAVLTVRERDFVLAVRLMGAPEWHIMLRTVLPNIISPLIVQISFGLAVAILIEASLSFLGLGVQPPRDSWGTLLQKGYSYIHVNAWLVTFPGLFIFATVWSLNMLGDGLRDVLDPKLRR